MQGKVQVQVPVVHMTPEGNPALICDEQVLEESPGPGKFQL